MKKQGAVKIISFILCMVMILGVIPSGLTVFAETTSGTCGDNVTWEYDSDTAILTISGTGAIYDYGYDGNSGVTNAPWKTYYKNIKKVIINDGVTSIGISAFYNCRAINSIIIGNSVTSIHDRAFFDCQTLKYITIGNAVKYIGEYVFCHCVSLQSISIPASVTYIGRAILCDCPCLEEIQLPFVGDKRCTESKPTHYPFGYIFGGMPQTAYYTSFTATKQFYYSSSGGLEEVTYYLPSSLKKITISGCEYIPCYAFSSCKRLTSITIGNSVTTIDHSAFSGCSGITSVSISDSVTSIGEYAFNSCSSLKNVYYCGTPEQWDTISIGSNNTQLTSASRSYHLCDNWFTSVSPTCTEGGFEYGVCNICGKKITRETCALGHSFTNYVSDGNATCTNDGTKTAKCDRCDVTDTIIDIDSKFGHDYIPVVTDPTCTENGYTTYTCSRCQDSYVGDYTGTIGHDYDAVVTPSTCTEWGYTTYTCSHCGFSYTTDYTEPTWHISSDWIIDTEPQIGVAGSRHKECTMCGQILETGIVPPTLQNPVVSISVNDCYTVKCNVIYTSGNSNNSYDLYNFNLGFNVRYSNQIEESFNGNGFWKDGYYYDLKITCDVPYDEWIVGNSYTCTATLLGVSDTFSITLEEIESVSVIPKECIKNMSGYYDGYWDDENQIWVYNAWFRYSIEPDEITVTMKDGMIFTGTYWEICEQLGVGHSITADQSYDNQWDIGEHKATMFIGNYETEYTVNVVGGPIARIEIGDMEITEFTHGYYQENGNYIYNNFLFDLTVLMNDGSIKKSSNGWIEYKSSSYSLNIDSSDQYNEQWSAGNTYEVTASLLGVSCTFNVTIKESPIASIQMDDIEIIEYTHGDWKNDRYIYNWPPLSGKAVMKDGSECILKFDGSGSYYDDGRVYRGFEVDGQKYSMFIDLSSQYEESWTAGNTYQINCQALGISDSFNIAITESPIASAVIDDLTLIQGMDSDKNGSSDYYYINPTYTVTFKDGTQKTFENGEGVYVGDFYSNLYIDVDQWQSPFEAGKTYELTGRIGPASNTFTLTIVENPVDWIEVLKNPDKTEYYDFEYFSLKGLSLRVHYKDGEYEDFTVESSSSSVMDYSFFSKKYQRKDRIWSYEIYPVGQTTIFKDLFGKEFEISITVTENPVVALSVRENEDKSLVLTVTKNDGTKEDWKILAISYLDRSHDGYITAHQVNTDHGFFDMMLRQDENGYVIALNTSDNQVIESNVLEESEWLEVAALLPNGIEEKGYNWLSDAKKEHYLGNLTAGNIDDTVRFVFESSLISYWEYAIETGESIDEGGNYEVYYIYNGDYVRQVLLKYLALDEIDLSLSSHYDPQTDTYRMIGSLGGGEFTPSRLEYRNGIWTAEYHAYWWDEPLSVYYCLNDEHKVIKIDNKDTLYGDLNGDGKINGKDGILCSQALAGWDVVYSELAADVNGDGKFNGKDGILLSQYLAGWDVVLG